MESIKILVSGNLTSVTASSLPVAGTVGLSVEFTFDLPWETLEKTAVFRVNGKTMDALCPEGMAIVPWELLQEPGCRLWAGVYGCNADGTVQIPTVWADLGEILPGADPTGDESAAPTLPIWQQLTQDIEAGLQAIIDLENKMIGGEVVPIA